MNNLKKYFNKLNWKGDSQLFNFGTGPEADWKIIFSSIFILIVFVMVWSIFVFIKIDKGEIFVVERSAGEEEKILDASLLKETVSYYQDKALKFERIKKSGVSSVDPSL